MVWVDYATIGGICGLGQPSHDRAISHKFCYQTPPMSFDEHEAQARCCYYTMSELFHPTAPLQQIFVDIIVC